MPYNGDSKLHLTNGAAVCSINGRGNMVTTTNTSDGSSAPIDFTGTWECSDVSAEASAGVLQGGDTGVRYKFGVVAAA